MENNNKQEKEEEEQQEIIQPSAGAHHKFMMDFESIELDNSRSALWRWLFSYLKPFRGKFSIYLIFLLIGTLITAITPLITSSIIDKGIIAGNMPFILIMSITYFSLLLFMAITTYYSQYGMGKMSQRITFDIRNDLFYKLQDMSLTYFDQRSSGDIMSITTNDVTLLNQLVGGQFVGIITSIVSIALTVLIMFMLNPFLALISLPVFPIFLLLTGFFRKMAIGLFKESRKTIGKVTSSIQENIAGAKVVQAYGQEKKASSEFDRANKANFNAMMKIRRYMATIFPLINLITTALTAIILLAGGFSLLGNVSIFNKTVTVGVLSAFIGILGQFFRPFMMLMQIQQVINSAMAASDRIYSLLEEKVEIPDDESPLLFNDVKGMVEFESASFGYILNNENEESKTSMMSGHPSMEQHPMMKQALEFIKTFPEPYSSFIMKNLMLIPPDLTRKLMMSLMGSKPEEIPDKIDTFLGESKYAVPNTEFAKLHPEYKTSFHKDNATEDGQPMKEGLEKPSFSFESMIPPEAISMMVKFLERSLGSKTGMQQTSGMGGEAGGMMGGGMSQMTPQSILQMLATITIPPEVYDDIPKIIKEAIIEQKTLIQHLQSKGYVLKDLSLNIPAGTTVAIVGETGAGKTTLIKLIARFYDLNDGSILIDGIDIKNVRKKDLRDLIGLVPQDAFLFTGSIKDNLLYAFENPTKAEEEKMIEVSKFLGLHNFIETLHKKYDTKLKENASNISIGQRQLIAFARALITDPKILILDEATSSVDPYTETLIQDALNKAREGRTTIIIAHRLSTIKNANLIIVLDSNTKGIVEQGKHESLLALNGKYKRLLDMQHRDIG
ncbi:MAG: ABC transporter ATP-binding protein [Candidatus Lokiarchaeota archaeon]|nr:ABC transporter ATP-binding protein [Candidatus Lokiarchaeota archaeon]